MVLSPQNVYGNEENGSTFIKVSVNSLNGTISWQFTDSDDLIIDITDNTNADKYSLSDDKLSLQVMNLQFGEHGIIDVAFRTEGGTAQLRISLVVYGKFRWLVKCSYIVFFVPCIVVKASVEKSDIPKEHFEKAAGESISFHCLADGISAPVFFWRKDGKLLLNSKKYKISTQNSDVEGFRRIEGIEGSKSQLTIEDLVQEDDGLYACIASNEVQDSDMRQFVVKVTQEPQPNYCLSDPCGAQGECESLTSSYICLCYEGFDGRNCENGKIVNPFLSEKVVKSFAFSSSC